MQFSFHIENTYPLTKKVEKEMRCYPKPCRLFHRF